MTDVEQETFAPVAASRPSNVIEALARVSREVEAIAKGRESQGYKFRGIEDVYNTLHGPLARNSVVIVPRAVYHSITPSSITDGNKTAAKGWHKVSLVVEFDVYGPGGVDDRLPQAGRVAVDAEDNTDKGFGKAMSYAYKNFVVQLFSIPTEDVAIDNEVPTYGYAPAPDADIAVLAERCRALPTAEAKATMVAFLRDLEVVLKPGLVPEDRAALIARKLDAVESTATASDSASAEPAGESATETTPEASEPSGAGYVADTEDPKMPAEHDGEYQPPSPRRRG